MEVLFVILFIGVVISAIVLGAMAAAKRKKALVEWAASRGLSFDEGKDRSYEDRYPGFEKLRQGSNRYAYNIMSGDWEGRGLVVFDYHYETYSTDNKGRRQTHHHYFSAVVLGSGVPLKELMIRPEGFFDKVAGFFGFDDIDFESAAFSRAFHVKSPDKRWAYDVLHARAIEYLMDRPRCTIDFDPEVVFASTGGVLEPGGYEEVIGTVCGLLDRLPDYVVKQQRDVAGMTRG